MRALRAAAVVVAVAAVSGCGPQTVETRVPIPVAAATTSAAPALPPQDWWGWNTASNDPPPLLPDWPWHNNTGVWRAEDRAALTLHEGDFTTTSKGQVIDGVEITGKLYVKHDGVVVKRSWLHDRVENSRRTPVRIIHCDIGDGRAGDQIGNGVKGLAHVYRSNIYGVSDGVQTTPSRGDFVMQDTFLHDFRYSSDARTNGGNVHNDGFKADSAFPTTVRLTHNTFWSWTMNNMTEAETATRDSGPNWVDKGGPLVSTGNMARDGTPENGLQNSGVMIANQPVVKVYIDGNLFRGHPYTHINVKGGHVEITNNLFATDEHVRGRRIVGGPEDVDVWAGNVDYRTRQPIDLGE